jgi:hypothetical protein
LSFSSDSRSESYWFDSTGYKPANTCGLISLKPGSGSAALRSTVVMVSPTLAAFSSLMPEMTKPTSPARITRCTDFGENNLLAELLRRWP